jgi:hypothetical protein
MMSLTLAVRDRLLAVLDLAERPGTPGEREAADHAIGRLVVANADAIRAILVAPEQRVESRHWRETAADCAGLAHLLIYWEQEFVGGLGRFSRLSQKQHTALTRIATRLRARGCRL